MEQQDKNERLGLVCCYFNPCNYLSRFINFIDFHYHISQYENVDLVVVESYSENSKYRINKIEPSAICVPTEEVYWQKEQLLNIGIRKLLEKETKYIAWLDADIEFINKNWVQETILTLKKHGMAQLFRTAYTKMPSSPNHIKSYSIAHCLEKNFNIEHVLGRPGELGYGYGYQSSLLKHSLLYDAGIMGTGDFLNLVGAMNAVEVRERMSADRFFHGTHPNFFNHYMNWIENNGIELKKLGVCDNQILVNYHGEIKKRKYIERERVLKVTKYDPTTDLSLEETGLSSITNESLKSMIKNYFYSRDEDGFLRDPHMYKHYRSKVSILIQRKDPDKGRPLSPMKSLHRLNKPHKKTKIRVTPKLNPTPSKLVVAAKIREEFFTTARIREADTLVIDKSKFLQTNSHPSTNAGQAGEVYLNFIVENYDNLPDVCMFINESIKRKNRKYAYAINKNTKELSDNLTKLKYTPLCEYRLPILLDANQHLLGLFDHKSPDKKQNENITTSKYTFISWFKKYINGTPPQHIKHMGKKTYYKLRNTETSCGIDYNADDNFFIGKDKILQHDKSYYEKLLSSVSNAIYPEEEHYLKRSWEFIFK